VSLGNPENSIFLKQLIKFMTEKAAKGARPIEAFNISATRFTKATYETFSKDGTARIEGEKWWDGKNPKADARTAGITSFKKPWRYGNEDDNDFQYRHGDTITAENFNATLGGAQISGFLLNEELAGNPYDDPWFTAYVLEYYSNIKIDVNGQSESYDYDIPEELQIDKTQYYAKDWNINYVNFVPKARGYVPANQTPLYGQGRFVGIFETEDNISTYDEFFKDRIAPIFFGAYGTKSGATIGPGKQDSFYVPNLCKLFMDHLGESPSFEDDTERRLFLLMGGQYYGENDLEFMNLMGSQTRDTTSKYNVYDRHPPEVLAYWQEHYEKAVAKEGPKNVDSYKVLEELIGSPITKKTFAHFITHGAPTSKPWANKVFPITTYTQEVSAQYAPFVTTMRSGPSKAVHGLTLVFRKYKLGQDNYRLSQIGELYEKNLSRAERKAQIRAEDRLFYELYDLRNQSWAVTPRTPTSDDGSFGTDHLAGEGSYLNNWPCAVDLTDSIGEYTERALGKYWTTPALTSDYRKAFKQADVWVLPEEKIYQNSYLKASKEGFKTGRNAGPQIRGENIYNGDYDSAVLDYLEKNTGFNTENNALPSGPRLQPWIAIDDDHTILDFNPANNMENLMHGVAQAIVNDLPGDVGTKFENYFVDKSDTIVGKQIFEPLTYAMQCLAKEYEAFEQRVKWYEKQIKNGKKNKEAAAAVTLYMDEMPDAQDSVLREYYILQIWIDSVNSAAVKVNEWLRHQQAVTACVQRFCIIRWHKIQKNSIDEIKAALEEEGIAPGKLGKNLNTPFNFDLPSPVPDADDDDLDPEEIKELLKQRAKNIDQCLLLTNFETFREAYHEDIVDMMALQERQMGPDATPDVEGAFFTIHKKKTENGYVVTPFGDRFHMLGDSEGHFHSIPNMLMSPGADTIGPFMNLTPELQAALVPKIRLFRVTDENGKEVEKEFMFENFVSNDEITSLRDASAISRGRGGGIKSFNWSYEGTTPATAKKDINAELVLYFQSFSELTRTRGKPGKEYKYIDLLLYPTNTDSVHPNEYQPANFRIRADVGWQIRDDKVFKSLLWNREIKEVNRANEHMKAKYKSKGKTYSEQKIANNLKNAKMGLLPKMKKALEAANKSFLLNKIDHEIDFRNDGTVELRITYAAYAESVSKTAKVNALSTPQIEFFRASMQDELKKLLDSADCRVEEIDALRIAQARREEKLIKAAQGSIAKRLKERGLYRHALFNRDQVNEYLKSYSTSAPKPIGTTKSELLNPPTTPAKPVDLKTQKEVGFYFLGDILHTVMDCLYMPMYAPSPDFDAQEESTLEYHKRIPGMERYIPLLSSFIYTDYNSKEPIFSANIADVPISAQYFNEWMVDNVVKSGRTIYPLMNFVKELTEVVVDLMTEVCINRQIDVSLMFQTAQIRGSGYPTGWSRHTAELDAEGKLKNPKNATKWIDRFSIIKDRIVESLADGDDDLDPIVINVDHWTAADSDYNTYEHCLPIPQGDELEGIRVPLEGYFDYNLIYAVSPTLTATHEGRGNREWDESMGTYHFHIGLNRGLMKNIKFSKSEMAYLREARYYNQGAYGLLQLGAVHNVDIELFGNTIFYPGMEIFIDPRNFGGTQWDPTVGGQNRSVANQLGIGGYHTITKVESTISPQGYNTKLTALFQYSGDGESRMMAIDGKTITTRQEEEEITAKTPARDLKCVEAVDNALRQTIQVNAKKKAGKKKWKKRTVDYSK